MVTMRLWTEFFLCDWTPVVLHAHIPLCLRVTHWTEGFLGKWRASARLIPLYTLQTTEEADWLMLLLTNQMCRYTQALCSFFVCVVLFSFSCRFLGFKFYCTVNILCKMKYINITIQCFRSDIWYLCASLTANTFLHRTNNDLYSGYICMFTGIFSICSATM